MMIVTIKHYASSHYGACEQDSLALYLIIVGASENRIREFVVRGSVKTAGGYGFRHGSGKGTKNRLGGYTLE
jgi:hypothetical protein